MRYIAIMAALLMLTGMGSCKKQEIGYLETIHATYVPNTMDIRLTLDEELDAYRIFNVAPWVSPKMQGLVGTNPIMFEVTDVVSDSGDAKMFRALLKVRGGGRLEFPLLSDIPVGRYVISLRIYNEGHSKMLPDAFTFIVKQQ